MTETQVKYLADCYQNMDNTFASGIKTVLPMILAVLAIVIVVRYSWKFFKGFTSM